MKDRIRLIREDKGLSRSAFGEMLGVSGDVINNIERGRVEPKEQLIKLIISNRELMVNERWLREGTGEMHVELSPDEELEEWIGRLQFSAMSGDRAAAMKKKLLLALKHIEHEETWEDLYKIADELIRSKTTE